ncbi:unnamed protein product [Citrullus colocynthis]|uniref:Uncharacterized protein n=1 Tax=Citrullus colocynthis TaxID=252529 RepID=A0ABP0Z4L5_9ROSI
MEAIASLPGMHSFLSFHRYVVVPLQFRSSTTHPLTLHRHSLHIRRSLNTVCATGSLMKPRRLLNPAHPNPPPHSQIHRHPSHKSIRVTAWCHSTHKPIRDNSPSRTICPPSLIAISFQLVVGLPTPPLIDSTVFQICLFIANLIVSIHCRFSRLPLHDSSF